MAVEAAAQIVRAAGPALIDEDDVAVRPERMVHDEIRGRHVRRGFAGTAGQKKDAVHRARLLPGRQDDDAETDRAAGARRAVLVDRQRRTARPGHVDVAASLAGERPRRARAAARGCRAQRDQERDD